MLYSIIDFVIKLGKFKSFDAFSWFSKNRFIIVLKYFLRIKASFIQ